MTRRSRKRSPSRRPASIRLCWKPPHGSDEPVPARCLSPSKLPERFVLTTPFPPDDRSVGYERGNAISKAWDKATTDAAIEVAGYVAAHRVELAGVRRAAEVRSRQSERPQFPAATGDDSQRDRHARAARRESSASSAASSPSGRSGSR